MYFNFVTAGLQILKQRMPQFQLKTFLSMYGLFWLLLFCIHALCIEEACVSIHVVLEGCGGVVQEQNAWDFVPEN